MAACRKTHMTASDFFFFFFFSLSLSLSLSLSPGFSSVEPRTVVLLESWLHSPAPSMLSFASVLVPASLCPPILAAVSTIPTGMISTVAIAGQVTVSVTVLTITSFLWVLPPAETLQLLKFHWCILGHCLLSVLLNTVTDSISTAAATKTAPGLQL